MRGKNSRSHSFQLCCKKFWLLNSLLPIIFRQCYSVSGECERNQYKVLPPTSIARFNFCCNLFSNYELVTGNNCRRAVLKYTIAGEGGDIPVVKHYFVEIYRSALVKRTYYAFGIFAGEWQATLFLAKEPHHFLDKMSGDYPVSIRIYQIWTYTHLSRENMQFNANVIDPGIGVRIILKWIFRQWDGEYGLNWSDSE